jgi:hypothetical protein
MSAEDSLISVAEVGPLKGRVPLSKSGFCVGQTSRA